LSALPSLGTKGSWLRFQSTGKIDLPELGRRANGIKSLKRRRQCFFQGKFMDTPIHDASLVGAGETIKGHAIVETPTTTIVIPPGFICSLDKYGTYILRKED